MIKTIKMKSVATYSDEGAAIDDCTKVNFFYGANGSGKSTISNYLQSPEEPGYSSCNIVWDAGAHTDIIVYNRRFRERNFKENIAGVFTLGEATIEDINALSVLKSEKDDKGKELVKRIESLNNIKTEIEAHKNRFRDTVWEKILKQNESDFAEVFSGLRGNKNKFADEVIKRYNECHDSSETRENLIFRANSLLAEKPEPCASIVFNIDSISLDIEDIEKDAIWSKIIVGNQDVPIAKLIDKLNNSDWVNQGRHYLLNNESTCPFCQQNTITDEFKEYLESFFSGEYELAIKRINALMNDYQQKIEQIANIVSSALSDETTNRIAQIDVEKLNSLLKEYQAVCAGNITEMQVKCKEPSQKTTMKFSCGNLKKISELINEANERISKHNEVVKNYKSEKKRLIDDVWTFLLDENEALISGYFTDLKNFNKTIKGMEEGIEAGRRNIEELEEKIIEGNNNITSVQPTVDEINRSLKSYGFTNFEIAPSKIDKNSYQIQRKDGTLASKTLSEGEETFITFLYFLQLTKGSVDKAKVSSKKIIVLDDPISSLDSTVLYIVSSMVKSLIKDVRKGNSDVEQVFILTHNVFFHKEASYIDGRAQECNDVKYWIINKDDNISRINSHGLVNPIKTSYELLWQELKTNTNASLVTTQNIMRRIIENYFGILGQKKDDKIVESFKTVEERMICRSLISWINDGSHSIPDDLYIDSYTDSIDRYKQVFEKIFFNMGHQSHYEMMMGVEQTQ